MEKGVLPLRYGENARRSNESITPERKKSPYCGGVFRRTCRFLTCAKKLGLQPTVFYRWQKEFFENGAAAFEAKDGRVEPAEQKRIEYLEKKIQTKDEVLAEHIALKKASGNSDRRLGPA